MSCDKLERHPKTKTKGITIMDDYHPENENNE